MNELVIKKLAFTDLHQILKIYEKFIPVKQNYKLSKQKYIGLLFNKNNKILVVKKKETIIGTLTGVICKSLAFGGYDFMVLDYLYVDEEYRHQGIATKLIKEKERIATINNCGYIFFVSSKKNTNAHRLYKELGYTENVIGFRKVLISNE